MSISEQSVRQILDAKRQELLRQRNISTPVSDNGEDKDWRREKEEKARLARQQAIQVCFVVTGQRRTSMRSASAALLEVPRLQTAVGDRSSSIAGPRAWNTLPASVCGINSSWHFRKLLKAFLFDGYGTSGVKLAPLNTLPHLLTYLMLCVLHKDLHVQTRHLFIHLFGSENIGPYRTEEKY